MSNTGGGNQFGNFQLQPAYGDVAKQSQLTRSAPMSGAPVPALNAPRRAQRQTQKPRRQPVAAAQEAQQPPPTVPPPAPQVIYQQIAQIPGVTPMWGSLLG